MSIEDSQKPVTSTPSQNGVLNPEVCITLDHHSRTIKPLPNQRNILITSALPYVNNVPHLGNIIGCVLSADVYARYCRARGYNTLFICGTDEYGTATETKAIEEGVTCQELCDKFYTIHKKTYEWFGCDFDYFGRTPTEKHTKITQDIFDQIYKNGFCKTHTLNQLYCETHKSFLADRYVEGICPYCKYHDARGDQCDGCGKLLNPTELIEPRCKLDKAKPINKETKHIFLDLETLQPELEKWVESSSKKGEWSQNTINITNAWLKEGLKERCITRDLKWGVDVPLEDFKEKVFYVWFDAPIGYMSITANYTDEWKDWWKNPENVQLYQFMGKDNVPFHTVVFPSSELATKDKWTMLHHISTTEYMQYENQKFSKSRGVGVFGNHAEETGVPTSVWRYYLLSNRPETGDSMFTWSSFIQANNSELLANLGNLVNRVVKYANAKYEGVVPEYDVSGPEEQNLIKDVNDILKSYNESLEAVKLSRGLKLAMEISAKGNQYLQENKIDNKLFLENRARCDVVVSTALNLIYLLSSVFYPYLPETSEAILRQLNLPTRKITDTFSGKDIAPNHKIGKAEYLFSRIDAKKEEEWKGKYGGGQDAKKDAKKDKKDSKKSKDRKPKEDKPKEKASKEEVKA